jgi:hypothetical protein
MYKPALLFHGLSLADFGALVAETGFISSVNL